MAKRVRPWLHWQPQWHGTVEAWARKFIRQNQWRADPINSFDDLLQDAYLTYHKIVERYPRVVEPKHFMSLFQRAIINQMHDHARKIQRKRILAEYTQPEIEFPTTYLQAAIAEAPNELKLALALLSTNPEKLRNTPKHAENLNMKLRRILGVGEAFDFTAALKSLLTNET